MSNLFTPLNIGSLTLKNRIIMTAVHTGFPIKLETQFLQKRAKGGAGAVTAVMGVSGGGAYDNMSVLDYRILEDLKKMAAAVHKEDGKLFVQLFHAGRNGYAGRFADPAASPVAPSPIASPIYREIPKELSLYETDMIRRQFTDAAQICREAGVDAVEISCSAGYLLSEFFSPLSNVRTDIYGGSIENRMKFPLEVIKGVRCSVGSDYPVILRVSGSDMLGGYGIEDTRKLISAAEPYINAVNVTGGWHESKIPQISMHVPEGGFAFLAREIKRSAKIPVIACNRMNNREIAEQVLDRNYADFIGFARAFLIDGDFANKISSGSAYRKCVGCNNCIEKVLKGEQVSCVFNPSLGQYERSASKRSARKPKKVLIAGAGPAGMQAALQYASAGHFVKLFTKEDRLGGLLNFAAKIPYKDPLRHNLDVMVKELSDSKAELIFGTAVDPALIVKESPDMVIVALGSSPSIPPIYGIGQKHVLTAQEVLSGNEDLLTELSRGNAFIIGGGAVGLETALFLMHKSDIEVRTRDFLDAFHDSDISHGLQYSPNITVVEMKDKLGVDLGSLRWLTLSELRRFHVRLMNCAKVEQILKKEVIVNYNGERQKVAADHVILALGYKSEGKELIQWLRSSRFPYKVIGDAKKVANISNALNDAYALVH